MSAFVEVKSDFLRAAAQAGWTSPNEISVQWGMSVPPHILARWLRQLSSVVEVDPAAPKRLVNHFKLGADPEFVFLRVDGEREDATSLDFKAAQAWGADNNGRLVEIRPCPSRHALAVTASIWATLHWMVKFQPAALAYLWRSGAWVASDGVGGHVHFGRKRPSWPREMQALDTLAFWLQHLNIFNQAEWRERIRRTRGRGNYGQLGDRREQIHGWEYRTIPSWLDSPWLAYCVLTLSKLAVFDPEFLPQLTADAAEQSVSAVRARLRGMLTYFKSRDDDAALAFQIFSRNGWPHFDTTDFKTRWGIFGNGQAVEGEKRPAYTVPSMVPVTPELVGELGAALLACRIPEWPDGPPTWQPNTLPKGYHQALSETQTFHHPGLGELVRDLVVSHVNQSYPRFAQSGNSRIDIPLTWIPKPTAEWLEAAKRRFNEITIGFYTPEGSKRDLPYVYLPVAYAANPTQRRQTVEFLTEGWAPIWRIETVREGSHGEWLGRWNAGQKLTVPPVPKPKRPASLAIWPPKSVVEKKKAPTSTPVFYTGSGGISSTQVDWVRMALQQAISPPQQAIIPVTAGRHIVDSHTGRRITRNLATREWEFIETPQPTSEAFWDDDPRT